MKLITKNLHKNRSLVYLNLASNNIGLEGASYLFEAMKFNQSVIDINLANELDGKG